MDPETQRIIRKHIKQLQAELPHSLFPGVIRKLIKEYTDKLST